MNLHEAAKQLREAAIRADDSAHTLREIAFRRWCEETVFPQAVNRWIEQIGRRG